MGKEIIMFGDIEVEKHKFHQHKISTHEVNIARIVVSSKKTFPLVKKVLNVLLVTKRVKKLGCYM